MSVADLTRVLDDAGAEYEVFTTGTPERAAEEADALGLDAAEVAKTLIARTPEGHLRALVPASDASTCGSCARSSAGRRTTSSSETRDGDGTRLPEFALGAVPPLGGTRNDPVSGPTGARRARMARVRGGDARRVRPHPDAGSAPRIAQAQTADLCED